ncbi:hypothetical protein [Streptomyces sp. RKAG293]|uniref:hypothetical protein n=1 Tax=Streptomyces sp. RKAG293 TaxID=2893403 RepID=UPI0020349491|nr:hypothetical protein [Streptomyces sp. RKAG293]MCM2423898.1 hypothetical protein [Streptomyces sp. RKAG293]
MAGATHYSFSDIPLFLDELGLPGAQSQQTLPGGRSLDITRAYVGAFFDLQLKHTPQPLLDGPTPTEPEVVFNNP